MRQTSAARPRLASACACSARARSPLDAAGVTGADEQLVAEDVQPHPGPVGHPGLRLGEFAEQDAGVVVPGGEEGEIGLDRGQVLAQPRGVDERERGLGGDDAPFGRLGVRRQLLQMEFGGREPQPQPQHQVLAAAELLQRLLQVGLRGDGVALPQTHRRGGPHRLRPQRVRPARDQPDQFVGVRPRVRRPARLGLHRDQGEQHRGMVLDLQVALAGEVVGRRRGVEGVGDLTQRAQAAGQPGQPAYPQRDQPDLVAEPHQFLQVVPLAGVVALEPPLPGELPQRLPAQHRCLVSFGGQCLAEGVHRRLGPGGRDQRERVGERPARRAPRSPPVPGRAVRRGRRRPARWAGGLLTPAGRGIPWTCRHRPARSGTARGPVAVCGDDGRTRADAACDHSLGRTGGGCGTR